MYKFRENITGKKAKYLTECDYRLENNHFLFTLVAHHCSMNSFSNIFNDELYHGDVIEIFISCDKPNQYLEFEIAPNGQLFLAMIENNDGDFHNIGFLKPDFLEVSTNIKKDAFEAKVDICLSKLNYQKGNQIKFNAFRIETDNEQPNKYLFALNPTLSHTFHDMKAFIEVK